MVTAADEQTVAAPAAAATTSTSKVRSGKAKAQAGKEKAKSTRPRGRIGRMRFQTEADSNKVRKALEGIYDVVASVGDGDNGKGRKDGFNYALSMFPKAKGQAEKAAA